MTPLPESPPARDGARPFVAPEGARPFVVVTGLSGAGKASILRMLEDLGFESIDNPPLAVLEELVRDGGHVPLAVGLDARTRGFDALALLQRIARLRTLPGLAPELIYVTAEPAVLMRRFSETRRRHPLAPGGSLGGSVADGIAREEALLAPLRDAADALIDTTELPLPELRRQIERRFRVAEGPEGMAVAVLSFAFPRGLPREADLVFDLRFLRNPHYDPALRPQTGRDPAVAGFIRADAEFGPFWQRMTALLDPLLPRYAAEGKKYLTVALGCTGGKHRSVLLAEMLAEHLAGQGWRIDLRHRELAAAERVLTGPPAVDPVAVAAGTGATGPSGGVVGTTDVTIGQDAQAEQRGQDAHAGDRGPEARAGAVAPLPHPGREDPSCTL
ncbi:RNase adapter RapZ [Roseomonas sp. USHLN139]|uniref:RNase adapter RapZ n=1 Tax=Roseomonas sp. USHLN139 TaxID=3081298 RepID=UPI003B01C06C